MQNIKLKTICYFNFISFFSSFSNKLIFKGSFIILFNSLNSSLFISKISLHNKQIKKSIISLMKILIKFLLLFKSIISLFCSWKFISSNPFLYCLT